MAEVSAEVLAAVSTLTLTLLLQPLRSKLMPISEVDSVVV